MGAIGILSSVFKFPGSGATVPGLTGGPGGSATSGVNSEGSTYNLSSGGLTQGGGIQDSTLFIVGGLILAALYFVYKK